MYIKALIIASNGKWPLRKEVERDEHSAHEVN